MAVTALFLRRSALFPEERVRQALLRLMVEELGYPRPLLVVERALAQLPHLQQAEGLPQRRIDLLAYGKIEGSLKPLLLVECKADRVLPAALNQLLGYNHFVGAPFVAAVGLNEMLTGWQDDTGTQFAKGLFSYEQLLQSIKS